MKIDFNYKLHLLLISILSSLPLRSELCLILQFNFQTYAMWWLYCNQQVDKCDKTAAQRFNTPKRNRLMREGFMEILALKSGWVIIPERPTHKWKAFVRWQLRWNGIGRERGDKQTLSGGAETWTIMPSAIKANTNNDLIISYFVTETDLHLINLSGLFITSLTSSLELQTFHFVQLVVLDTKRKSRHCTDQNSYATTWMFWLRYEYDELPKKPPSPKDVDTHLVAFESFSARQTESNSPFDNFVRHHHHHLQLHLHLDCSCGVWTTTHRLYY